MQFFGRNFKLLDEEFVSELSSLEQEGAIYANHWIDELGDFYQARIAFTQQEAKEYARRLWAYELFLQAGHPQWAKDGDGIDPDIADQADSYELKIKDDERVIFPWHCPAAFFGSYLEGLTCSTPAERQSIIGKSSS